MQEFDLHNSPKITSGFKTPDGYFDDFSERLMAKLPEKETKIIPMRRNNWMYAAAAILVVSLTIPVYNLLQKPTTTLDNAAVENYLASNNSISDHDFAELLDEEDIAKIKIDSDIESVAIEDLLSTNANLEEYLIN